MVVCTGGSEPKPGVPAYIHVDKNYIASILPSEVAWFAPFIPYLPEVNIAVGDFCAIDPPEFPTLDAADLYALITRDPISLGLAAGQKGAQLVHWAAWYALCKCSTGSTPAIDTGHSAPSDLPVFNPVGVVQPGAGLPCATFTGQQQVNSAGTSRTNLIGGGTQGSSPGAQVIPAGATRLDIIETQIGSTANQDAVSYIVEAYNAAGSNIANLASDTVGPTAYGSNPRLRTLTLPSGAYSIRVSVSPIFGAAPWTQSAKADVSIYCAGSAPGQPLTPCCPPDSIASGLLAQILETVTLLQRQVAPFAYVPGAEHSALSGTGSLTVSGLLGFSVDTASVPGRAGLEVGTPDLLFDLGRVSIGTADGWLETRRINADPFVWLPPRMSTITRIGYTIPADVSVTLTELIREP